MILGALEAGGTKMVCAIGDENGNIIDRAVFPTTTPDETIGAMIEYFGKYNIQALGIGSFGPVDLNKESKTYGEILNSPKLAWQHANIVKPFEQQLDIPIELDTDVDAALLGELVYGSAKGAKNAIYVTVGTGIGAGVYCEGKMVHGQLHTEVGHILIQRRPGDNCKSSCHCHDNCLEGLASGPALALAFGRPAQEISDNEELLERESYYMGQAIATFMCMTATEKIILGGGVMQIPGLIERIREQAKRAINGYLTLKSLEDMDNLIVLPGCGGNQGILGALELAKQAVYVL